MIRLSSINLSIASSLGSKLAGAALQIFALPIAAHALGGKDFALYVMLSAFMAWLMMANIGLAPSITIEVAKARARGLKKDESVVFISALSITLVIAISIALIFLIIASNYPVNLLFGSDFSNDASEIYKSLIVLVFFACFQLNIALFEGAQLGYQRQYVSNALNIVGVVSAIFSLVYFSKFNLRPSGLIVALNLPLILSRLFNCVLLLRWEQHLKPKIAFINKAKCKYLIKQGLRFSLAGPVNNFLSHLLPIYLVGRFCSPSEASSFAVVINALVISSGIVTMCCIPFVPAIVNAISKGENSLVILYINRITLISLSISLFISTVFLIFGQEIFNLWYGGMVDIKKNMIFSFCFYFIFLSFEVVGYSILTGLGEIRKISTLMLSKSIFSSVFMFFLLREGNEYIPLLLSAAGIVIFEFLPFLFLIKKHLHQKNGLL